MVETEQKTVKADLGVEVTAPTLHRIEFVNDEVPIPEGATGDVEYELALHRFGRLRLGVEFGVSVNNIPGIRARASFRMVFALKPDSPGAENPEESFRAIAARVAPMAIYPFVREAIASAAIKAQVPSLVLPIANVGALYRPQDLEIPSPPESEEEGGSAQREE